MRVPEAEGPDPRSHDSSCLFFSSWSSIQVSLLSSEPSNPQDSSRSFSPSGREKGLAPTFFTGWGIGWGVDLNSDLAYSPSVSLGCFPESPVFSRVGLTLLKARRWDQLAGTSRARKAPVIPPRLAQQVALPRPLAPALWAGPTPVEELAKES